MTQDNNHLVGAAINQGAVPEGYKEIDVTFYSFIHPGDAVKGRLIAKQQQKVGTNTVGKYTVMLPDQTRVSFIGTTQLDEKLNLVPLGYDIIVTFEDTMEMQDQKNPMKLFKVFAKKHETEI